jgi:hypothetical protein
MSEALLVSTLELAIPLWVERFADTGGPCDEDFEWAREFAWVLGSDGDKLFYRDKKQGETARLFNDLARALAIMAHVPGGVTLLGRRWECGVERWVRRAESLDESCSELRLRAGRNSKQS